ncbi:Holliday junction branch migration protein RuvA [Roseomonas sp. SSH11]|uniref:Holliday junction branch migration complex subunit RuvA n=1 Tax=Pararoseomonas baculiformis TaxID=2820812 RepID=A0ABS4AH37_9PROT|nr:Holliday junction branch migration protein RuvA [Pararoseomonas baculiformis]MBP0446186.1 Holliday junction branch migration protein RuvA [Pararoseomonas baculiformis]
MIGKLTGRLDSVHEGGCILDVNGVGYLVAASSRAVSALPQDGKGTMWIETVVREDAITLYGFADAAERDWFRLLTGIQGVGPKVALGLLSALSPRDLAAAIMAGDKGSLTRAPGVGPKLAVRLLSELREKVGGMPTGDAGFIVPAAPMPERGVAADAVSALLNLGWRRPEAASVVARVQERLGEEADLNTLIRESLKEMAPR